MGADDHRLPPGARVALARRTKPARDLLESPLDIYHEGSKLKAGDLALYSWINHVNQTTSLRRIISRPRMKRRCLATVALPRELPPVTTSLEEAVTQRRSVRQFSGQPMSLEALAKLLWLGDGIVTRQTQPDGVEWPLRTAPSGGGLFPLDILVQVRAVEGLEAGLYAYEPEAHALQQLSREDRSEQLGRAANMGSAGSQCCVTIAMCGVFARMRFKYGERSYRFMLLEAGHIAQNLLLAAQAQGLGAVPVGGFVDDELNAVLGLDGVREAALYLVAVGQRASG